MLKFLKRYEIIKLLFLLKNRREVITDEKYLRMEGPRNLTLQ